MSSDRPDGDSSALSQPDSQADSVGASHTSAEESLILCKLKCRDQVDQEHLFNSMSDFKVVASYSWMDKKNATISVPGCPPLFKPPPLENVILPDPKDSFVDQNAARFPSYPLEPVFRSLEIMSPDRTMDTIELITCEDTLNSLLMFVCGCASTVKFDVEVIGTTAIFTKIENPNTNKVSNVQGYGAGFLHGTTTWDPEVKNSICHFRVAQFRTGGINCLLRYKCNAYVNDRTVQTPPREKNRGCFPAGSLKHCFSGVLKGSKLVSTPITSDHIDIKKAGQKIDQELTTEIQTTESAENMSRFCPRLWMTQTSLLTTVDHHNGRFAGSNTKDVSKEVTDWENDHKMSIVKLKFVIRDIIEEAKKCPDSRLWVKQGDKSTLLLLKPNETMGKTSLPTELKTVFFPTHSDKGAAGSVPISETVTAVAHSTATESEGSGSVRRRG